MPILNQSNLEVRGHPQSGGMFRRGGSLNQRRIIPVVSGGGGGGGGFALVNHFEFSPNGGGLTTSPVNLAGSDLIIVFVGTYKDWYANQTNGVQDSNGNTYTHLTLYAGGSQAGQFWYCRNPTGSLSALTFTFTGVSSNINLYSFFGIMGFSGGATSTFDQESGALDSNDPLQPGSITPTAPNSLVVSAIFQYSAGGTPTCSDMTSAYGVAKNGNIGMGGDGYVIQTAATAINPTWVSAGAAGAENAVVVASFKP